MTFVCDIAYYHFLATEPLVLATPAPDWELIPAQVLLIGQQVTHTSLGIQEVLALPIVNDTMRLSGQLQTRYLLVIFGVNAPLGVIDRGVEGRGVTRLSSVFHSGNMPVPRVPRQSSV